MIQVKQREIVVLYCSSLSAKSTYNLGEKWELTAIYSNGWKSIQRVEDNSMPSGGAQVVFKPTDKFLLIWSTFATTEFSDS